MNWKYGDAWEKFPIEPGEVWKVGLHAFDMTPDDYLYPDEIPPIIEYSEVAVHNIFDPLPVFMRRADCIFVDPPYNLTALNSFYTKAGRDDYQDSFATFADALFRRIGEIKPHTCYIEIGKQNVDHFRRRLKEMYPVTQEWPIVYYRKHPTWILRAGYHEIPFDFTALDEARCIEVIARDEEYDVIGDLCMGRGLVGVSAWEAGRTFVGTELNKRRLACLLAEISKRGGEVSPSYHYRIDKAIEWRRA